MLYRDLLPFLLARNLVQTRPPPRVLDPLPAWYRADRTYEFHQGAPGHDIEHCYPLKNEVQRLIQSKDLSLTDSDHNVQNNPLPPHGPAVNMIEDYQEAGLVLHAQDIKTPLVQIHVKMCEATLFSHDHDACEICSMDSRGCIQVREDIKGLMDRRELVITREEKSICVVTPVFKVRERLEVTYSSAKPAVTPLVICLPGPKPYVSQKAIPYKYESTILEDDKEIPLSPSTSVDNIAESSQVLRSGRILPDVVQKKTSAPVEKAVPVQNPGKGKAASQPSGIVYEDSD